MTSHTESKLWRDAPCDGMIDAALRAGLATVISWVNPRLVPAEPASPVLVLVAVGQSAARLAVGHYVPNGGGRRA